MTAVTLVFRKDGSGHTGTTTVYANAVPVYKHAPIDAPLVIGGPQGIP